MYTEYMSEKTKVPTRLSLPLSEEEREKIIDLKSRLQKERRSLKEFVMGAIWKEIDREKGKKK